MSIVYAAIMRRLLTRFALLLAAVPGVVVAACGGVSLPSGEQPGTVTGIPGGNRCKVDGEYLVVEPYQCSFLHGCKAGDLYFALCTGSAYTNCYCARQPPTGWSSGYEPGYGQNTDASGNDAGDAANDGTAGEASGGADGSGGGDARPDSGDAMKD